MSKNYVSVRVKPVQKARSLNQLKHDTRESKITYLERDPNTDVFLFSRDNGEIKITQSKNNEQFQDLKSYLENLVEYQKILYEARTKRKPHPQANDTITGIITFTDPTSADPAETRKTAMKYIFQLCAKWNIEMPFYLAEHHDEKTMHYHFQLPAFDRDGRSVTKKINRDTCTEIQDLAGEMFGKLGFDRGERTEHPRKHYTVREAHRKEIQFLKILQNEKTKFESYISLAKNELQEQKKNRKRLIEQLALTESDTMKRKEEYRKFDEETKILRENLKRLEADNKLIQEKIKSGIALMADEITTAERTYALREITLDLFNRLKKIEKTTQYDETIKAVQEDNVKFLIDLFRTDKEQETEQKR